MSASDLSDILGLPPSTSTPSKHHLKSPPLIINASHYLTNNHNTPTTPSGIKGKRKIHEHVQKWRMAPFITNARRDHLLFRHWTKISPTTTTTQNEQDDHQAGEEEEMEIGHSNFENLHSKKIKVFQYSNTEYNQLIVKMSSSIESSASSSSTVSTSADQTTTTTSTTANGSESTLENQSSTKQQEEEENEKEEKFTDKENDSSSDNYYYYQWTRQETDQLFRLCKLYDLRFPVIYDRFCPISPVQNSDNHGSLEKLRQQQQQRRPTMEEMKDRYYSIATLLLRERAQKKNQLALINNHPIIKSPFNLESETRRKSLLESSTYRRNVCDVMKEEMIRERLKRIETVRRERLEQEKREKLAQEKREREALKLRQKMERERKRMEKLQQQQQQQQQQAQQAQQEQLPQGQEVVGGESSMVINVDDDSVEHKQMMDNVIEVDSDVAAGEHNDDVDSDAKEQRRSRRRRSTTAIATPVTSTATPSRRRGRSRKIGEEDSGAQHGTEDDDDDEFEFDVSEKSASASSAAYRPLINFDLIEGDGDEGNVSTTSFSEDVSIVDEAVKRSKSGVHTRSLLMYSTVSPEVGNRVDQVLSEIQMYRPMPTIKVHQAFEEMKRKVATIVDLEKKIKKLDAKLSASSSSAPSSSKKRKATNDDPEFVLEPSATTTATTGAGSRRSSSSAAAAAVDADQQQPDKQKRKKGQRGRPPKKQKKL